MRTNRAFRIGLCGAAMALTVFGWPSSATAQRQDLDQECQENATILGTPGDDHLVGTDGIDIIAGLGGNDIIEGLAGFNFLCGMDGNDRLIGGDDEDFVLAGSGNDSITLGDDGDPPEGSPGNIADGAGGNDAVLMGPGNDFFFGGPGKDSISFATASSGVTVDVEKGGAVGQGTDWFGMAEHFIGSGFGDIFLGSKMKETFVGVGGDDLLQGAGGDDLLEPGDGNDLVEGGTGKDRVDFHSSTEGVLVNMILGTASGQGSDVLAAIEHVTGSGNDDTVIGSDVPNSIAVLAGNDVVDGGAEDDKVDGGKGTDICNNAEAKKGCEFGVP